MNRAQLLDWYETHPSNTKEPKPGTPTLAKERALQIRAQTVARIQGAMDHQAKRDDSPAPEPVHFQNRAVRQQKAVELHRRKFEALVPEVVPAYNAIETPTHGYSPAAKRMEKNRRKRERRAK